MTTAVHTATAAPATRRAARLPRPVRHSVLTVHLIASVGWLGLTIGNLTMAITGVATTQAATQQAMYQTLSVIAPLVAVLSVTAWASGIVLALGTPWGLWRHKWVALKLTFTTITLALTYLSLLPGVAAVAERFATVPPDQLLATTRDEVNLLVACCVSLTTYTAMVLLSVFKPFGRTKHGRRSARPRS